MLDIVKKTVERFSMAPVGRLSENLFVNWFNIKIETDLMMKCLYSYSEVPSLNIFTDKTAKFFIKKIPVQ